MIKLLISDFDGTLVDTFQPNFLSYKKAFEKLHLQLSQDDYRASFGLRYDSFMTKMNITDDQIISKIKELKSLYYPDFFQYLRVNKVLLNFITCFKNNGGKTALASTASRGNLINAMNYIGATNSFDLILTGEAVKKSKPNPEIYIKVLDYFKLSPSDAIVFEDSAVGIQAAKTAGINYIEVNNNLWK